MWMRRTIVVAGAAVMTLLALAGISVQAAHAAGAAADTPKPAAAKPATPAAAKAPAAAKSPAAAAAPAAAVMPGNLADFWMMWPKAGKELEFETAVKAHLAWRKQAGEGWSWETYQPVVGTDITYYAFRSGLHHWADFDAHQAWEMSSTATVAFNRDIAPLVGRYEHYISEEDYANSHWVESPDYRYFMVEDHKLKAGMSGDVSEAVATIHKGLEAGGWTGSYAISRGIGGMGGLTTVFPYKNYAGMEDPKPGFMEVLIKGLGSADAAKAAVQKFHGGVEEVNTTLYLFRPELSTSK